MNTLEDSIADVYFSCENYLSLHNEDDFEKYLAIVNELNITLIAMDGLTLEEVDKIIKSYHGENLKLISSQSIYDKVRNNYFTTEQIKVAYKDSLISTEKKNILLFSRKTIKDQSIELIKQQLSSNREKYEIISVFSKDKTILKWAAHDRRVDYLTFDLLDNSEILDVALCSVVKQNNKCIEIVLSTLLTKQSDKELSIILRKGKKLIKILLTTNTPFIFTMNPENCYHLRNGYQMRFLGELIDAKYNKTKNSVLEIQLSILIENTSKLHDSHVIDGVRKV